METLTAEEREIFKLSEPIPLTNIMVKYSFCIIIGSFVLLIGIAVLVYKMGWLLVNDPNDRDFLVWGD